MEELRGGRGAERSTRRPYRPSAESGVSRTCAGATIGLPSCEARPGTRRRRGARSTQETPSGNLRGTTSVASKQRVQVTRARCRSSGAVTEK